MFAGITGASPEVARGFLEMAGGDIDRAVTLFFENPDLVSGVGAGVSETRASPAPAAPRRNTAAREDSSGVIHIPSDDDDDHDMDRVEVDSDDDLDDGHAAAVQAAAMAQEEEDAAMAQRLQQELYQGQGGPGGGAGGAGGGIEGEDVRAPIARTTETLVAPDPAWGPNDGVEAAMLEQLRRRRQPPRTYSSSNALTKT